MRFRPSAPALCLLHRGAVSGTGLLLACLLLSGCGEETQAEKGEQPPALVRVAQLKQQPVARKIEVVGNVTPVRTSIVASGANGVVQFLRTADAVDDEHTAPVEDPAAPLEVSPTSLPKDEVATGDIGNPPPEIERGQFVARDTVLSVLRMEATNNQLNEARQILEERQYELTAAKETHPQELAHAAAMLKMSEAVETNAKSKWERTQTLYNRGVANENELEDAREKWQAASQSVIAARQKLLQVESAKTIEQAEAAYEAQKAHVAFLGSEKAKRTTKAPFDGFIVDVHTYVGQWLSKGDPVVTLARMDEVDVIVNVDQADLPYVRVGQTASVRVRGAEHSEWTGNIVHIVPQADWRSGSRSFPVVVRIDNRFRTIEVKNRFGEMEQRQVPVLKAGMIAQVTISGPEVEMLLAHKDTLVRSTRGTNVFVFNPQQKNAKLDPNKPTMGSVQQIGVEADLNMSVDNFIAVRLKAPLPGEENPLKPGMWVVTEGGERLRPVQDNVNALSPIPNQSAPEADSESEKPQ